ncbi:hypothetical protein [Pseudoalteromonas sp. McH1-42]|nr:hypothetical protein [Pseudoalteromonas sp. McH1-42]
MRRQTVKYLSIGRPDVFYAAMVADVQGDEGNQVAECIASFN